MSDQAKGIITLFVLLLLVFVVGVCAGLTLLNPPNQKDVVFERPVSLEVKERK